MTARPTKAPSAVPCAPCPTPNTKSILRAGFATVLNDEQPAASPEAEPFGGFAEPPGDLRAADRRAHRRPPLPRGRLLRLDQGRLQRHLRLHRPEDHQWRRPQRSSGRPHPPRRRLRSRLAAQRSRALRHRPLDVRPRPDLDRRQPRPPVREGQGPRLGHADREPRAPPARPRRAPTRRPTRCS